MSVDSKPLNPQIGNILLVDIDKAIIKWFEKDNPLIIKGKTTPVMYVAKERWAQIQRDKAIKDERGQIILPVISVRRLDPQHRRERNAPVRDETDLIYHRRVASQSMDSNEEINLNNYQRGTPDPKYLYAKDKPVFEILKLPYPSFFDVNYEIILWASYLTHQNIEIENIITGFNGGRTNIKVGEYNLLAIMKNISDESNTTDFTSKERIIKSKFILELQAYLIDKSKIKISRTIANMKFTMKESNN